MADRPDDAAQEFQRRVAKSAAKAEDERQAERVRARKLAEWEARKRLLAMREAEDRRQRTQQAAGGALPAAGHVLSEGAALFAGATLLTMLIGFATRRR